ncbi:hypothetical protein [Pseudomonas sp. R37(2017)]|nr:hypothetical protein [Pseudomonas sp. R37(2017)]
MAATDDLHPPETCAMRTLPSEQQLLNISIRATSRLAVDGIA